MSKHSHVLGGSIIQNNGQREVLTIINEKEEMEGECPLLHTSVDLCNGDLIQCTYDVRQYEGIGKNRPGYKLCHLF